MVNRNRRQSRFLKSYAQRMRGSAVVARFAEIHPVNKSSIGRFSLPHIYKPKPDRYDKMNTAFLLMAQYDGQAIIPAETVCKHYFSHLSYPKFLRKVNAQQIDLPLTYSEQSQKSAKGVHLQDLAEYLDKRRSVALRESRSFR